MTNVATPRMSVVGPAHQLGVARLLVAGGLTAAAIFIVCWLGTFIPLSSPTHAYIALFTQRDASSLAALAEGTFWALLFGALSAVVFALVYNATASLDNR
jgi:hypothetical protein